MDNIITPFNNFFNRYPYPDILYYQGKSFEEIDKPFTAGDIILKSFHYLIALNDITKPNFEEVLTKKLDINSFFKLDSPYIPLSFLLIDATKNSDDFSVYLFNFFDRFFKEKERIGGLYLFISSLTDDRFKEHKKHWEVIFKSLNLSFFYPFGDKLPEGLLTSIKHQLEEAEDYLTKTITLKILSYNKEAIFELIDSLTFILASNIDFMKWDFIRDIYKLILIRIEMLKEDTITKKSEINKINKKLELLQNAMIGRYRIKRRPEKYKDIRKIYLALELKKIIHKEAKKRGIKKDFDKAIKNLLGVENVEQFVKDIKKKIKSIT